jgi:hypothetical protein
LSNAALITDARRRHLAVALAIAVSAALSAYIVSFPHWLLGIHGFGGTGYDDGTYTAASTDFVHGVLPYQNFVWVEPPGTIIFLAPLALLGRLIGTQDMLAVGRVITVLVAAANAGLAAYVLRSRGWLAMAVAGLTLACFPLAPVADHSMNMEPYFVLFVLLGAAVAFDGSGRLASPRRLVLSGALLAVATSFKVWGVALLVALVICCLPQLRAAARAVVGYAATLLVISLPFLIISPIAYWHQAVTAQLHRSQPRTNLSVVHRLTMVFGLTNEHTFDRFDALALTILAVIGALVVVFFGVRRREVSPLEWFALVGTVLLAFGLLHASQFYDHYAYATAAMLALLVGVLLSRLVEVPLGASSIRVAVAGLAALVVLVALAVPKALSETRITMHGSTSVNPAIDADTRPGSCVVGDYPIVLVEANRWDPSGHCDPIVDPFGLWIQYEETEPPGHTPYPKHFVNDWHRAFDQASAVVLLRFNDYLLPADPGLRRQLRRAFTQVSDFTRQVVYSRQ